MAQRPSLKQQHDKKQLHLSTAESLEHYLAEKQIVYLPPQHVLAKKFNVGESTMGKAIRELALRGVIRCSRGRAAQVVARIDAAVPAETLNENGKMLYRKVRDEILNGTLKTSQPLPKINYLAAKLRISRRYIVQVLRILSQEKLIHKEGKKWIVGSAGMTTDIFTNRKLILNENTSVVLLLTYRYTAWNEILQCYRQNTFPISLLNELDKHKIRMIICGTLDKDDSRFFPAGIESVRRLILSLKDRYLGTITVNEYFPQQLEPDPSKWLEMFARTGKPLVWCDLANKFSFLSKSDLLSRINFCSIPHDEKSSVTLILDALRDLGHKRIGVPYLPHPKFTPWSQKRMILLTEIAARSYDNLQIIPVEMTGALWQQSPFHAVPDIAEPNILINKINDFIHQQFTEIDGSRMIEKDSQHAKLLAVAPFLSTLIKDKHASAIIAPNDYFASHFYILLSLLGFDVPHTVSIVSFDNSIFFRGYPLSTIDQGYHQMAYCAVHKILGDIPIRTDRDGSVRISSFLVDRGSLAAPRRK